MCIVSMMGDQYQKTFPYEVPTPFPNPKTYPVDWNEILGYPSKKDFDDLKEEVQELRKLLKAAKEYDAATGQPDCEMDEKVGFIKSLAEFLGVDMSQVFGK